MDTQLDYCGACLRTKPPFDNAYTIFRYQNPAAYLIKQFKYHDKLFLASFFADKLKTVLKRIYPEQIPLVLPMPLNRFRTKTRGFNQVHYLLIKAGLIKPAHAQMCVRTKPTKTLSQLSAADRKRELKGAFRADYIQAEHILLVDDVMTTGSSFAELTHTIKHKNPHIRQVDVLCLARA